MSAPNLTFSTSKTEIGLNDYMQVTFESDIAYLQFEARATLVDASYGVGIGTLVGAFSSTPATTERSFEIYDTEIVNGDGTYRISLFAQGEDGSWNDNHQFITNEPKNFITSDGENFLVRR